MILDWKKFVESVGEIPIEDYETYIDAMVLGMSDKLFFVSRIKPDVIVDFGCADGKMLASVKNIFPEIKLIAYDIDERMLVKARANLGDGAVVTSDWNKVLEEINGFNRPTLVLSSVIHEVYSYSSTKNVRDFWEKIVFGGSFKYVSIRDMIPSVDMDSHDVELFKEDVEQVRELSIPKYLNSFENIWGGIDKSYRTFVHYLLKYKYIDNWQREVKENYVPIALETLLKKIPSTYKVKYRLSYIYKYLADEIMKDFGVTLHHTTHTKLIIENTKFQYKKNTSE
jgi:ribosomal protein L11 methylase PrmA